MTHFAKITRENKKEKRKNNEKNVKIF